MLGSALLGWGVVKLGRGRRARRRWRARVGRRPRGALREGEAALCGTLLTEEDVAVSTLALGATPREDAAVVSRSAPGLRLRVGEAEVELRGALCAVHPGAAVAPEDTAARDEASAGLDPELHWLLDDSPFERRVLRAGETVFAYGELVRDAGAGSGYRDGADSFALRPVEGEPYVLLHARPATRAWWGAPLGAALVLVALALVSSFDPGWRTQPRPLRLLLPWERAGELRHLEGYLHARVEHRNITREQAELRLMLSPALEGMDLARTLLYAGRRDEARAEVVHVRTDPFRCASALVSLGFGDDAFTELREIDGPEARAHEVVVRVGDGGWFDVPRHLPPALDAVCGEDWTCAAHARLLWSRGLGEPPSVRRIQLGSGRRVEEVELWLRVAGTQPLGDARTARSRLNWQLALAEAQITLGADDAARATLAGTSSTIARWPDQTGDLAREVEHYEDFLEMLDGSLDAARVHGPDCPMHRLQAALRGEPVERLFDVVTGRASWMLGLVAEGETLTLPADADDVRWFLEGLPWVFPALEPDARDALAAQVVARRPLARAGSAHYVKLETLRARALIAIGRRDLAEPIREAVAEERRALYGW